jgi:hypothetical protein
LDIIEFSNDSDIVKYAIYLWICITRVELKFQSKNISDETAYQHHMFTTYDLDRLLSVLLKHLCQEKENEKDNDWNPFKESAVCLMLLSTTLEQEIIPHLIPFINANLNNEESWQLRDAALIAFGSMLVNFQQADPFLKKLFHFDDEIRIVKDRMLDSNEIVKGTAECLAYRICEKFPDKKSEFDENFSASIEISQKSFKYMLFRNDFSDFSTFDSSKTNQESISKIKIENIQNESPQQVIEIEPQPVEEIKPNENNLMRSNSNNPVIK